MTAFDVDPVQAVYDLVGQGRAAEALELIESRGQAEDANHLELAAYATVLKSLERKRESLEIYERAVRAAPDNGIAEHNLAAMLEQVGRFGEAETAARRSMAKGTDAPETWAVLARSLQAQTT